MRLVKLARSYLRQAKSRLEDAKEALLEPNYPYAVRLSQECVELSLKAALRVVGIDYPKMHDVSDVMIDVKDRFPIWFRTKLGFLSESSKMLVKKRELSFYGGEEALLAPDEVISKDDAEDATTRAEKAYRLCEKLLDEVEKRMGSRETPRIRAR